MTVLVLGAGGLLGSNVCAVARDREFDVTATVHSNGTDLPVETHELDVRNTDRVESLLSACDPDVVVNCVAMADVDECERAPERARDINGLAPGRIATVCSELGSTFVHISTDYVFSGDAETPYSESDDPCPIQVYGRTKRLGDRTVRDTHDDSLIVRPSFLYGTHRVTGYVTGFPRWISEQLTEGGPVSLFTDQHVTPSRAGQVAETIFDLLAADARGLFHVASRSCVTPYDVGVEIAKALSVDTDRLTRSVRADLDRPAPRPAYSCLAVGAVEDRLGRPQPTVAEDLNTVSLT